ncbi:hypothetical protein KFL_013840020 [Klebsormidium nitens]|uniref:Uncharacterized protein n=1 Tax=Klebsormidium nitens TaxID=105231 RepID=A0A1Y1IQQ9_KLENI|nr:hypothetical protein KFL_013840020 [Klebsormidium nitens]|eukprot:GAQ93245.1 hypothetical protein KFL_013840020 [Klebsormidium nitens]
MADEGPELRPSTQAQRDTTPAGRARGEAERLAARAKEDRLRKGGPPPPFKPKGERPPPEPETEGEEEHEEEVPARRRRSALGEDPQEPHEVCLAPAFQEYPPTDARYQGLEGMDLVGVREELLEDPRVGPILVYFAEEAGPSGTAGDGEPEDAVQVKKLQEAYDMAAKAQETRIVWDKLDQTLNKLEAAEEAALQGKKVRRGRKGRDLEFDMKLVPRVNVTVLPDEYAQMFTTAGVEEVPEATLASDNDDPLTPPPPRAEARQTLEEMSMPEKFIYEASAYMGSDLMDRHIPYHDPKPRKPKPQTEEPPKSETVEKVRAQRQIRGRAAAAQRTGIGGAKKRAHPVKRKVSKGSEPDDSDSESGDSIDDFIVQGPEREDSSSAESSSDEPAQQAKGKAAAAKPSPAEEEMERGLDYLALGPPLPANADEPPDQGEEAADAPAEGTPPPADADATPDQEMEAVDMLAGGPPPPADEEAGRDEEMGAADQPAGGGTSGGHPGEDPPDPEKKGPPPEDEATPMEEEEKEEEKHEEEVAQEPERAEAEEQGEPAPVPAEQSRGGEGKRIFRSSRKPQGTRARGLNHLTVLERGFLRNPEDPFAHVLITPSWRTSRADRKKGPQWNELKDNELHGYLNHWAHAVLEYKPASKKEGADARTTAWYEFVYQALARVGTDLLELFRQRREQREPHRPDFAEMV